MFVAIIHNDPKEPAHTALLATNERAWVRVFQHFMSMPCQPMSGWFSHEIILLEDMDVSAFRQDLAEILQAPRIVLRVTQA